MKGVPAPQVRCGQCVDIQRVVVVQDDAVRHRLDAEHLNGGFDVSAGCMCVSEHLRARVCVAPAV